MEANAEDDIQVQASYANLEAALFWGDVTESEKSLRNLCQNNSFENTVDIETTLESPLFYLPPIGIDIPNTENDQPFEFELSFQNDITESLVDTSASSFVLKKETFLSSVDISIIESNLPEKELISQDLNEESVIYQKVLTNNLEEEATGTLETLNKDLNENILKNSGSLLAVLDENMPFTAAEISETESFKPFDTDFSKENLIDISLNLLEKQISFSAGEISTISKTNEQLDNSCKELIVNSENLLEFTDIPNNENLLDMFPSYNGTFEVETNKRLSSNILDLSLSILENQMKALTPNEKIVTILNSDKIEYDGRFETKEKEEMKLEAENKEYLEENLLNISQPYQLDTESSLVVQENLMDISLSNLENRIAISQFLKSNVNPIPSQPITLDQVIMSSTNKCETKIDKDETPLSQTVYKQSFSKTGLPQMAPIEPNNILYLEMPDLLDMSDIPDINSFEEPVKQEKDKAVTVEHVVPQRKREAEPNFKNSLSKLKKPRVLLFEPISFEKLRSPLATVNQNVTSIPTISSTKKKVNFNEEIAPKSVSKRPLPKANLCYTKLRTPSSYGTSIEKSIRFGANDNGDQLTGNLPIPKRELNFAASSGIPSLSSVFKSSIPSDARNNSGRKGKISRLPTFQR